jgi:hypothetical protein
MSSYNKMSSFLINDTFNYLRKNRDRINDGNDNKNTNENNNKNTNENNNENNNEKNSEIFVIIINALKLSKNERIKENFHDVNIEVDCEVGNASNIVNVNTDIIDEVSEMIEYTVSHDFKGLFVEPRKRLFEKISSYVESSKKYLFENSFIHSHDGNIEIEIIDDNLAKNQNQDQCKNQNQIQYRCMTFESLLSKHNVSKFDVIEINHEIFGQIDIEKYKPKMIRITTIEISDDDTNSIADVLTKHNYVYELSDNDIVAIQKTFYENIYPARKHNMTNNHDHNSPVLTLVTGLWDINRGKMNDGWARSYQKYIDEFIKLLGVDVNMIIFGDEHLRSIVKQNRIDHNTQFILRKLDWFKNNKYYDMIQKIRNDPVWYTRAEWLKDSTQAKLEMYNPIVMSKMFLLHDAKIFDKFNSDYMFWIDAGITFTVNSGYFIGDKVLTKLPKVSQKFTFITFPYINSNEIHGFVHEKMCKIINDTCDSVDDITNVNNVSNVDNIDKVARGGFFGGPKETLSQMNSIYYDLLIETLDSGFMGTEESIFTIIVYSHYDIVNYVEIAEDGLLYKFFEDLKNDRVVIKSYNCNNNISIGQTTPTTSTTLTIPTTPTILTIPTTPTILTIPTNNSLQPICNSPNVISKIEKIKKIKKNFSDIKTHLYVLTFNSPEQFECLIDSFIKSDKNFLDRPKKFLLNNSTDRSTDEKYSTLCKKYDFEQIKKDNIGICGGRQFVAEHFESSDADYYIFFEDDMFLQENTELKSFCKNGFRIWIMDLYEKSLQIMHKENYDFLKINFTEFYGGNEIQWAWYNVPNDVRMTYFPNKPKKPKYGFAKNPPLTKFTNIKKYDDVLFIEGEVYYCNWPLWFSKEGNVKVFLKPKFDQPFEQTWMSCVFQKQKQNIINSAVLLLSPVNHNRIHHYGKTERKEN